MINNMSISKIYVIKFVMSVTSLIKQSLSLHFGIFGFHMLPFNMLAFRY